MSYEKVQRAKQKRIGLKQTLKSIQMKEVDEVLIAEDADPSITHKITHSCQEHNIPFTFVDSMKRLGKACGIDVGAATVAIKM